MKKILLILAFVAVCLTTASAQRVCVMSYNVKNGYGMDKIKSIERCAKIVKEVQPDVVAVQELDSCTRRNNFYVLGKMAEAAGGYYAYFSQSIPYKGGAYGIGILSKKPAVSVKRYPLPCRKEPRSLLVVEFKKYYLLCTHLSLNEEDRITSVAIIRDVVSKLKDKPVFIAGDMNARPASKPVLAFKEFCEVLSNENKFTIPSTEPRACIDYIFGTNGSFQVLKEQVIYDCIYSDHLPLWVDVKIGKAKKAKK